MWRIKCGNPDCTEKTVATQIVDLIEHHRDPDGWFLCRCGEHGYIAKTFALQEEGQTWAPFLKGIIPLGSPGDSYQPFVFLVSHKADGFADSVWFSYYKDLRSSPGGRLKLGYGPGGPPVLEMRQVSELLRELAKRNCIPVETSAVAST